MATRPLEEIREDLATLKSGAEEVTPVTEESDSNEFSDLVEEMEADDQVVDFGLDEATEETEEETTTEAVVEGEPVPAEKAALPEAVTEEVTTEESSAPTEEPIPVEVVATTEPVVQETESETKAEPETVKPTEPEPGESYETLRANALVELEKDFTISEEDAQTLVTEPEKVLPKLAAQIYMVAYENATKSVMAALPQMIRQTTSQQAAAESATKTFYEKWDKLDSSNKKHSETVARIATVYRQVNPMATAEQFIAEVGAQSLLALGIPFAEIIDSPPVETPPAFQPAAPSGAAAVPRAPKTLGAYEVMAEEFLTDDD